MCKRRVSLGSEELGSTVEFTAVLATPGVAVDQAQVCAACGGDAQHAEAVVVYLHARCGCGWGHAARGHNAKGFGGGGTKACARSCTQVLKTSPKWLFTSNSTAKRCQAIRLNSSEGAKALG